MKILLLADIHGNLPALEAVLRHARSQGANQLILNLGDMTGYGPFPDQVVRWSQNEQVVNILGNYDQKVVSKEFMEADWGSIKNKDKRAMFRWTNQALSKSSRDYIASLPEQQELVFDQIKLLLTHGSPDSISEHLRIDTPDQRLAELAKKTDANLVLCGHSHQAFIREVDGVYFVNPGTVGRQDDGDPRASYAIIEIDREQLSIEHFRIAYDIMESVRGIRAEGLPEIIAQVLRWGVNYQTIAETFKDIIEAARLEPNGTITLLTDFGIQDHFVGVMKGVITHIAPQAQVIDISHKIQPQNIHQAAHMLIEAVPWFPPGTIHVAVVDPGVGTERRAIAAQIGDHYFVAPDNGILTPCLDQAGSPGQQVEIVSLNQPKYWLPEPSSSFHGRDIFSPIAAHLCNGILLDILGERINDPVRMVLPQPQQTSSGWLGEVIMVDVFGNLSTNLPAAVVPEAQDSVVVKIQNETIEGITRAFGDKPEGTLIATIDSTRKLGLSIVNGSAAEQLGAGLGTPVEIQRK